MKILYWTELFWPSIGGVEVLSTHLLPAMRARGHEFVVVTSHHDLRIPDEVEWEGIPVHRFRFPAALRDRDLREMMRIRKRLTDLKKAFQPDLVHINYCDPSVFFHMQTEAAWPAADVLTIQSFLYDASGPASLQAKAFESVDWVVANSHAVLLDALEQVPAISERASAIHPASLVGGAPEPATLPFDPPHLLCLGRLVDDKGFDVALNAFARVLERYPAARLTVSGDGTEREALEKLAADLGITNAVTFPGWVTDTADPEPILDLINTATIVVMPSRWKEPFGLVALQGSQMARPVVATRTGGLQEIIADGETGILFERDDHEACGEAILSLLANPARAVAMGQAGRVRAEEQFGWVRYVDAYEQLYERLVRERRASAGDGQADD